MQDAEQSVQEGTGMKAEPLTDQVERLAEFIQECIPGEPSQSQGAIDTAIRLLADAYGVHEYWTYMLASEDDNE